MGIILSIIVVAILLYWIFPFESLFFYLLHLYCKFKIEKSIDEIHTEFQERLSSDTNTLIDISSSDPHLRKLASEINIQLRLLRKERHRYQQGDLELKEAITNISHDLRTPLTAINGYLDLLEREEKSETVHCYLSQIQNRTDVLKI